jgi:hypothetical protein
LTARGGVKGGGPLRAVYFGRELCGGDCLLGPADAGAAAGAAAAGAAAAGAAAERRGARGASDGSRDGNDAGESFYRRVVARFDVKKRR